MLVFSGFVKLTLLASGVGLIKYQDQVHDTARLDYEPKYGAIVGSKSFRQMCKHVIT